MKEAKEKEILSFTSGMEMHAFVRGVDLYSRSLGIYAFIYTESGSICSYTISSEEAEKFSKRKEADGLDWSAHLGIGGSIFDSEEWLIENSADASEFDSVFTAEQWCEENYQICDWEVV